MEIDPHNLPSEVNLLQQIVLQLLQAVEDKDQLRTTSAGATAALSLRAETGAH